MYFSGNPSRRRRGALGVGGIGGLAAFAYRAAPALLRQYTEQSRRPILPAPFVPDPLRWPERGLFAAWLGHSTVLFKLDGFTVLTDPVFSDRAGLQLGPVTVGVKRLVAPALVPLQLPRIDLILLSHAHMDHTDLPSLRALQSRHTAVVTAARNGDLLRTRRWRRVIELGWNESERLGPAGVRAFEVNHWGARMRTDTYRGYNGYLVECGRHRILFAGDTAVTTAFRRLRTRRPIDLAIMPIGAYNPWLRFHCTPEEAWAMASDAGAEYILPVHHLTFPLGHEPRLEPIERLDRAAASHRYRIAVQRVGQEFRLG